MSTIAIPRAVDAERDAYLADLSLRQWANGLRSEAIEERVEAALYRCTPAEFSDRIAAHDLWPMVDDILHAVLQEYRALISVGPSTPARLQAMHRLVGALIREEIAVTDIEDYRAEVRATDREEA